MNDKVKTIYILIFLVFCSFPLFAQSPPTGDLPATQEEQAEFDAHASQIIDPGISQIGRQRIAESLGIDPSLITAKPLRSLPLNTLAKPEPIPVPTYTLPSAVDNSALNAFPPIASQGAIGSCASFCTTYYMLTHMTALARGWDAKSGGTGFRFSTRLTYNMINGGNDNGSSTGGAVTFIRRHGGMLLSEWGYNNDYRIWPTDAVKWRNALSRKISAYGSISGFDSEEGLNLLRQMLVNGYVLVFSTGNPAGQWKTRDMLGTKIVYMYNTDATPGGGHAMTIVGYDDDLWCDVNNNAAEDPGEHGAVKIANSWGVTDNYGMNAGFYWVAYDALRRETAVSGWTPPEGRRYAFNSASWILAPSTDYRPELVCEFTVRHPKRRWMVLSTGKALQTETEPETVYSTYSLRYAGGEYAFDGTTTVCDGSFVLDMSPLEPDLDTPMRYFLTMQSSNGDGEDRIIDMVLKDADGTLLASAANTPLDAVDSTVHAYADLTYTSPATETVTLSVIDSSLSEFDLDPGTVRISRTSSTGDLGVNIELSGTAYASDYMVFSGSCPVMGTVLIPDGSDYVDLDFVPVDDVEYEDSETIIISVARSADYLIGTDSEGTLSITDNDNVQIEAGVSRIVIPEGSSSQAGFRLTAQPASDTDVTVSVGYGDFTIGSSPVLTFTTSNWDTWQFVTFTAADNADTGNGFGSATISSPISEGLSLWVTILDDESLNIVTEYTQLDVPEGTSVQCGIKLNSDPGDEIDLETDFYSGDADITVTSGETLTFTSADWDTWQYITFTSADDLDGFPGSTTFSVSSGSMYSYITLHEIDDDTPGITLVPGSTACIVNEGSTSSFSLKLSGAPAGTVTVNTSRISGDTDISVIEGASLDFTPENWNTLQFVKLEAKQDADCADGEAVIQCLIPGIASCTVTAREQDLEKLNVETEYWSIYVPEGSSNTVNVRLSGKPSSTTTVTASRTFGDTDLSVSSGSVLTFTPSNWDVWQTVTISAAEDADADQDYAQFELACPLAWSGWIQAYEVENEISEMITDHSSLEIPEGTSVNLGVRLSADPGVSTVVTASLNRGTDVSITAGGTLTFDSGNWDVYQYVTLEGLVDADVDDANDTLTLTGTGTDRSISIWIRDADQPAMEVDIPSPLKVSEGKTKTIRFRFASAVPDDTNINIYYSGGDPDLTVEGGTSAKLTFTSANWDVWQTVTIEAADDADKTNGWGYFSYNGEWENGSFTAYEVDNDKEEDPSPLSCSAGSGTDSFYSVLLILTILLSLRVIRRFEQRR